MDATLNNTAITITTNTTNQTAVVPVATAAAAGPLTNANGNTNQNGTDYQERYRKLKKKYALLLQEHQKVLNEFEKSNEEIRSLNGEKTQLKNKINDVLARNGFDVQAFVDPANSVVVADVKDPVAESANLADNRMDESSARQDDSAIQQE